MKKLLILLPCLISLNFASTEFTSTDEAKFLSSIVQHEQSEYTVTITHREARTARSQRLDLDSARERVSSRRIAPTLRVNRMQRFARTITRETRAIKHAKSNHKNYLLGLR